MQVQFEDFSGTTGGCDFLLDENKCIEFALEYHEEQLIKIPAKSPTFNRKGPLAMYSSPAKSRLGFTEGTMTEFGSIKTARNVDFSEEFTTNNSDFRVIYYAGSDGNSCVEEFENGSTGDTNDRVPVAQEQEAEQPAAAPQQEGSRSFGSFLMIVGSSVAVGIVGLMALPVAVGVYGVTAGFGNS